MLLAQDGRRLSKRDQDLDLGEIQKHMTAEKVLGLLAYAAGLIDQKTCINSTELTKEFSWDRLKKENITINPQDFCG